MSGLALFCASGFAANVAVVISNDVPVYVQARDSFKKLLAAKGVSASFTDYNLKEKQISDIASQVASQKPDVVFVLGNAALSGLKDKLGGIPVVFCMVYEQELSAGPNITGVTLDISPQAKLNEIRHILPGTKKIGMLYSDELSRIFDEYSSAAGRVGVAVSGQKANSEGEMTEGFKKLTGEMDCFLIIPDKIYTLQMIKFILLESLKNKIPVIGLSAMYTKAGALASIDCNYDDIGRQAGEIAVRILNGEKPAGIKVERPRKVQFTLNSAVAQKLETTVDPALMKEASEVFGQ